MKQRKRETERRKKVMNGWKMSESRKEGKENVKKGRKTRGNRKGRNWVKRRIEKNGRE